MLPNCKIQIFKTFKRMRLLPKKENTQKNLHTQNIAHDPLPSSAKPKSSIPQTFFGRQTVVLPKKFSLFFNCASRCLLRQRRNSIKNKQKQNSIFLVRQFECCLYNTKHESEASVSRFPRIGSHLDRGR